METHAAFVMYNLICELGDNIAGDDPEAGSRLGRGAVQYATKSQPTGLADGSAFTGRCHGRYARSSRRGRRRRLRVQQLRRTADRRAARRGRR